MKQMLSYVKKIWSAKKIRLQYHHFLPEVIIAISIGRSSGSPDTLAFPSVNKQKVAGYRVQYYLNNTGITAAGTAPDLNRIPILRNI